MRVYHGTVAEYLPAILKEGLIPRNDSKNVHTLWGDSIEDRPPSVYLSTDQKTAELFAAVKADWLSSSQFGLISVGLNVDIHGPGKGEGFVVIKPEDQPIIKTKPVLLTLEIPENWHLSKDRSYGYGPAKFIRKPIPPNFIISHEEVKRASL